MRLRRGPQDADAEHPRWPPLMADRNYRRLTVVGLALVLVALAGAGVVSRFGASPTGVAGPDGGTSDAAGQGATGQPSTRGTTPGQRPTATPTPTVTTPGRTTSPPDPGPGPLPAPPNGFPDASTTGYRNAPGYPGKLTRFTGTVQSNKTYKFMEFPDGAYMPGISNVTFIGCRFTSNEVVDATVVIFGDNITFQYSSFEPVGAPGAARTVNYRDGYQYAIDQRGSGNFTVEHSDFWGWGNAIQFGASTQANPVIVKDSWFHHPRTDGGVDHTDAILESYGGPSYMIFDHNTIVGVGNTNGLALQGKDYSNVTITRNYFSGFGYTVNAGGNGSGNRNVRFVGNTFGTDLRPVYGPLYGWRDGSGNLWRQNKWRTAPGGYSSRSEDNGKYWWPDGSLHTTDYTG